MDHESTYRDRLRLASRKEFRKLWTDFRWWLSIVGLFNLPIIVQVARGKRGMLDLGEAVGYGLISLVVSLAGSYAIAMRSGAAALDGIHQSALQSSKDEVDKLEEKLSKKHPRDEYREQRLADTLKGLQPEHIKFLKWLLGSGRSNRQAIGKAGFGGIEDDILHFTKETDLVKKHVIHTANGIAEIDREYWINPNFELALTNYFYPPPEGEQVS